MALVLYNTASRKKEAFVPLHDGAVSMYNCGPTVYHYAHIGNLRSYIFADTLRRTLELHGYQVTQVINITDVGHLVSDGDTGEDKMTRALQREGKPLTLEAMKEIANRYTEAFTEDLKLLNISKPEYLPKASEHITEDIEIIKKLEQNDLVYKTSDGVYFDTARFPAYGALGGTTDTHEQARIAENTEKKNWRDFAVWKFNETLGWESPWGKGFPGWHIECSGMSMKYLGETIDIHTGGIDHIGTHHNNEIAQSEGATGKQFVRYWLHGAFLNLAGEKVAKSTGNVLFLHTLAERGFHPLSYRYLVLQAHYRTPLSFSWEALAAAQSTLEKLITAYESYSGETCTDISTYESLWEKFKSYLYDDLNTPQALSTIHQTIDSRDIELGVKKRFLVEGLNALGIPVEELSRDRREIPEDIREKITKRTEYKEQKQWEEADRIRAKLAESGYTVHDDDSSATVLRSLGAIARSLSVIQQRR